MSVSIVPAKVTLTCDRCDSTIGVRQQNELVPDTQAPVRSGWARLVEGDVEHDLCVKCRDAFNDFMGF